MGQKDQYQFGWVGQFLSFEPGEKSPQQYLVMRVATTDRGSITAETTHRVKMGSSLRRMMLGYLEPQDWIRVVGKEKIDSTTGEPQWKAREVVKVSAQQAMQYAQAIAKNANGREKAYLRNTDAETASISTTQGKPKQGTEQTRILICQKSSCQQRGAARVERAIAQTITNHNCSQRITLVSTGCMKQCKTGPHLVVIPPKQPKTTAKNLRYTHVNPQSVSQIVENLL